MPEQDTNKDDEFIEYVEKEIANDQIEIKSNGDRVKKTQKKFNGAVK